MFINMAVSLGGITLTNTLVLFSISNAVDSSGRHHVLSILHDYIYDFGPFLHMHVFSFKNAHACFLLLLLACSLIYLSFSCLVSWQRILWGRKKSINKLTYVLRMMLKIQINQTISRQSIIHFNRNNVTVLCCLPYETLIWFNK